MVVPSYHYMIGPAAALLMLGVILLICRWVFSTKAPDKRRARHRAAALTRADYGLLVPIVTTRTAEDAEMLRGLLREAGIRCTVGQTAGTWQVMVFRADAPRASELVRG